MTWCGMLLRLRGCVLVDLSSQRMQHCRECSQTVQHRFLRIITDMNEPCNVTGKFQYCCFVTTSVPIGRLDEPGNLGRQCSEMKPGSDLTWSWTLSYHFVSSYITRFDHIVFCDITQKVHCKATVGSTVTLHISIFYPVLNYLVDVIKSSNLLLYYKGLNSPLYSVQSDAGSRRWPKHEGVLAFCRHFVHFDGVHSSSITF